MPVQKAVELVGEGDTLEEAIQEALDRAALTLEGVTSFTVEEISGEVQSGRAVFQVRLKVWFTLLERIHG